tara:strand:+ start:449 stop:1222 length:774 start_codon:yes stop_codon:yes gene_type:complete
MSVTVILNGYKRKNQLTEQLEALNNSTVKPDEILLWYNNPEDDSLINYDVMSSTPTALCNYNFGVWARFAFALNAQNEYICVFDDDTIPGKKWLENCIETMKTHEGLLGSVGLLYLNPLPPEHSSYYEHYLRFGWPERGNNDVPIQVDLVGHSWFFKKEWLSYMWREIPHPKYNTCGEDMHFSYMLQKYANIPTYVPPHPTNNKEIWGSIKGSEYGGDQNAMWETNQEGIDGTPFKVLMNEYFINQRKKGWKLINER